MMHLTGDSRRQPETKWCALHYTALDNQNTSSCLSSVVLLIMKRSTEVLSSSESCPPRSPGAARLSVTINKGIRLSTICQMEDRWPHFICFPLAMER
ncbi:hypothetical protein E2C01_018305 [Portunus trituberculatus]|uniref:Uncharacterized protein n=1 Tax=Portunus trituberculatus TaxID=210409 RepID=A0A5B7DU59_PORTR|nr:hypothetical protein [Portunus trituberculatus]